MKPQDILKVLDLAHEARKAGRVFNPMFAGDAGLGKSQICQEWVALKQKDNPKFGFIDLRLAYLEAPDLIGLVQITGDKDTANSLRTSHILPEMWPQEGTEGLLLIEEPNRANTSVLNAMMQLLTDRKVHNYKLPEGWVIAACINPDNSNYEVNSMDTALRDRFEIYDIKYDNKTFIEFVKDKNWHQNVQNFLSAGTWVFKSPDELGTEGKYISPRTWSKLNAAELSGLQKDQDLHYETVTSILGQHVGKEYFKFTFDNRPVTADDLLNKATYKEAIKRLKQYSDPDNYKGDLVAVTVKSVLDAYPDKVQDEKLAVEVATIIPADQAVDLLRNFVTKSEGKFSLMDHMVKNNPDLAKALKAGLRGDKTEMEAKAKKGK